VGTAHQRTRELPVFFGLPFGETPVGDCGMDRFVVMLSDYELADWQVAAEILIDALGMFPATARKCARNLRGFLAESVDREQAEKLQRTCEARGLSTYLVQQQDMVAIPSPNQVCELWICDDNLWLRHGYAGPRMAIRWDSIVLITACLARKTESYRHWSTSGGKPLQDNIPQTDGPCLRITEYTEDSAEFLADVFAMSSDKDLVWFRLGSRKISFKEVLKLDAHLSPGARLENFRLLVTKICAKAVNARIPSETKALIECAPRNKRRFRALRDPVEFQAFNRWALQKLRIDSHPGNA
jgi:hypothetical protein